MSFCALTPRFARHYHRAPDFHYMQLWKDLGVSYQKSLDSYSMEKNPGRNLYQSPQLVRKILQTQVALKERDFVPFIHAMPAASRFMTKLFETAYPSGRVDFKYLRSPADPVYRRHRENIESPGVDASHLSMSYALSSGTKPLESAASWGFVNHFGAKQNLKLMEVFSQFLEDCGIEKNSPEYAEFTRRGFALIWKYSRLQVGEFVVVGVPFQKVDRFVYDSMPYNVPTGTKASSVAADPAAYKEALKREKTHMATMPICDEVMNPDSGVVVVSARDMDTSQIQMSDASFLNEMTSSVDTDFERQEEVAYKEADQEMEDFAMQFKNHLAKKPVEFKTCQPDTTWRAEDYEHQMI